MRNIIRTGIVIVEAMPQVLRDNAQWVGWKYIERDEKTTKVPINAKTGEFASSTDPSTWAPVKAAYKRYISGDVDGIGYTFNNDFIGVDLDNAIDPGTGEQKPWAREIVEELPSYTEWSPSGLGIHLISEGRLPEGWSGTRRNYEDGAVEIYSVGRYFTMTGNVIGTEPLRDLTPSVLDLYKRIGGPVPGNSNGHRNGNGTGSKVVALPTDQQADRLEVALRDSVFSRLWYGDTSANNNDDSSADLALCNKLVFYFGRDAGVVDRMFRQSKLCRPKWENREDYRSMTINKAINDNTEVYTPPAPKPAVDKNDQRDGDSSAETKSKGEAGEDPNQPPAEKVWPEPQPVEAALLPVEALHVEMIPAPLRGWLTDIAERMSCSLEFVATLALVVIAAVIGAACGIRPKKHDDWLVVPNLWGGVVARPGALKTPTMLAVTKPLDRLAAEARAQYQADMKEYEAEVEMHKAHKEVAKGLMKAAASGRKAKGADAPVDPADAKLAFTRLEEPTVPAQIRFKTNDATIEKLGELLAANPRGLLVFRDELIGLLASWDREGREADRAFFLECWAGTSSHDIDRIGRGSIHVKHTCLSLFGGIPPAKLLGYLYGAMRGQENDGFVQRLQMMVFPDDLPATPIVDRAPDTAAGDRAYKIISKLAGMDFRAETGSADNDDIPYFHFDDAAQEVFYEWFNELNRRARADDEEPVMAEHLVKYRSLMPSLALIIHLIDIADGTRETGPIPAITTRAATAWCDFLESHARRVYFLVTNLRVEAAARLSQKILSGELQDRFTLRDVYRRHWSLLDDKDVVADACAELIARGWLREEEPVFTIGRPRAMEYRINPRVSSGTSVTAGDAHMEEKI